ncbi:MAG: HRDC domain-containing protein [Planctomycetota bacterium]|nr:HRDC domain-containing protein [Planctomycetota bacterium]
MGSDNQSSKGRGRRRMRDQQHQASHDDAVAPGDIPNIPMVPSGTPDPMTSQEDLRDMVAHVRSMGTFAYDTEFIGEETYFPQLCLVQVATVDEVYLVDPLAIEDLTPIWELIMDPDILTLVHAGQQDLEPVCRLMKSPAANVIDTQIAAGFAGLPYPCSLNRLILDQVSAKLGKGMTFTHWDKRPLSSMQRRYAADDVRYLPLAWSKLQCTLETLGHLDWMHEECAKLCDPSTYVPDYDSQANRLQRNRTMRPGQRAMLHRLVQARDLAARETDVPPRSLLADEIIMALLKKRPQTLEDLAMLPGMPRPVSKRHGEQLLAAIKSDEMPPMSPPRPRLAEETVRQRMTIDSLWAAISTVALAAGLSPALLSSRAPIAKWCLEQAEDQPLGLPDLPGWRGKFLRQSLGEFLAGDRTLELSWQDRGLQLRTPGPDGD